MEFFTPRTVTSVMGIPIGVINDLVRRVKALEQGGGGGGINIYSLTDSGNHQAFTISGTPATANYKVYINGGVYFPSDSQYGFSVSGTTLTFTTALDSVTAATVLKLEAY